MDLKGSIVKYILWGIAGIFLLLIAVFVIVAAPKETIQRGNSTPVVIPTRVTTQPTEGASGPAATPLPSVPNPTQIAKQLDKAASEVAVETLPVTISSFKVDSDNILYLHGFVQNNNDFWLKQIRVNLSLIDKDGGMYAEPVYTALERTAPGATVPFGFVFDLNELDAAYESFALNGADGFKADPSEVTMELRDVTMNQDGLAWKGVGSLANTGQMYCNNPLVIAAGYDDQGRLFALKSFQVTGEDKRTSKRLLAGGTATFDFELVSQAANLKEIKLLTSCGN